MKKRLLLALLMMTMTSWAASRDTAGATQGTVGPALLVGASDDNSVGTCQWMSPGGGSSAGLEGLLATDNNWGPMVPISPTYPVPREDVSHYLRAFNAGLDVPAGATVTAVVVTVKRRMTEGNYEGSEVVDGAVHLVKDGVVQTAVNKADTTHPWSRSWVYKSYVFTCGDLTGWTAEDFEDSDFGVALSVKLRIGETEEIPDTQAQVDAVSVTLYTEP
jgi:hypothetical protein